MPGTGLPYNQSINVDLLISVIKQLPPSLPVHHVLHLGIDAEPSAVLPVHVLLVLVAHLLGPLRHHSIEEAPFSSPLQVEVAVVEEDMSDSTHRPMFAKGPDIEPVIKKYMYYFFFAKKRG